MSRFGVVLPYWLDRPPEEALAIGGNADRFGFRQLWVGEMLTFDAFGLAGALAATTASIPIVVGPLAVAVRDPVALALGVATVAAAGRRPAHLALGASSPMVVEQWHDRPWHRPVDHMAAALPALRTLLAGGRHRGFRLRTAQPGTTLSVAAFGPRMTKLAAATADGVVVNLLTPSQLAGTAAAVAEAAAEAGRPAPGIAVWVPACIEPGAAAMAQLKRQLVVYCAPPGYGEMFTAAGFGDVVALARGGAAPADVAAAIPDEMVLAVSAIGDRAEVLGALDRYTAAGASVVGVVPVTAEDAGGSRLLAALAEET